ncbi:S9 family peptidase, partial [candidate division KSB1 bacterium]
MRQIFVFIALLMSFVSTSVFAAAKRPITIEDLWAMKRIGEICLSPDGKWLAYTVTEYSMEQNKGNTDIWLLSTKDGTSIKLTNSPDYDGNPAWSADSKKLAFVSTRAGNRQIYLISISGGEARRLTNLPIGVHDIIWSPDGKYFAFTTSVYPNAKNLDESVAWDAEKKSSQVKAKIITRLFYRYWNRWLNDKRSHIFIMPATADTCWDITSGDYDSPPLDLRGVQDYVFSPDAQEVSFVRNTDSLTAISTNNDVFVVPVTGGEPKRLTPNPATDNQPVYSPDGRYLAYRAMRRAGFEADQYDLILYDRKTGTRRNLTQGFDYDVGEVIWSPKSDKVYFNSKKKGRMVIFELRLKTGEIRELVSEHYNTSLTISPEGRILYFKQQAADMPYEIFKLDITSGKIQQLTFINQKLLSQLMMNPVEDFWFTSFDGRKVHGLLVKPPFFDSSKKYPLIYLIHGGPQGMWSDNFHYRWNCQMFASPGYVVAMVNFRGSKGYGQEFCDLVSKDWGGGPYQDLMVGLDYLLQNCDFINKQRIAAAGASYGGFMINWIAGHTNPFKCLVSHDGVFDQISMYGATEELWFPEWE